MRQGFLFFCLLFIIRSSYSQKTSFYSEGLAANKINGKYGFIDIKGREEISYEYDTVYKGFRDGYAVVGKNRKAGLIDRKGKEILPFEFESIGEYNRKFIPVENEKGLWGFYSYNGDRLIPCLYDNFRIVDGKLIVQRAGKWGIIDTKDNVLLEFNYKELSFEGKHFWGVPVNKWTLKNFKNETLTSFEYDSVRVGDGVGIFIYSIVGNHGLCDSKGLPITAAIYDYIFRFKDGLAVVKKRDNYGVINSEGKIILPINFKKAVIDSIYLRVQEKNGRWMIFGKNGVPILRTDYIGLGEFSEGLISAMGLDSLWGYITIYGQRSTLFRFSKAAPFKKGMADVEVYYPFIKKNFPAIINKKGDFIIKPDDYDFYETGLMKISADLKANYTVPREKYSAYELLSNGMVRVRQGDMYGVITSTGQEIIPVKYDYVSLPSDGHFIVELDSKSGVINSKGERTIQLTDRYEKIYGFHEGLSRFLAKGRYGLLDTVNNVYISPQYPKTGEYSDGLVAVVIKNRWGFMDKNERLKVQPYYDEVWPFKYGGAKVRAGDKYTIVNKEGKELHPLFDDINETFTGRYLLRTENKYGLADKNGREILAPKYDQVIELGNGYIKVERNKLWGILDYEATIIIPLENDALFYDAPTNTIFTVTKGKKEMVSVK